MTLYVYKVIYSYTYIEKEKITVTYETWNATRDQRRASSCQNEGNAAELTCAHPAAPPEG